MTPSDLWKQVKAQFTHRPYLYSALKRLKDRDEVTVRRGKYLLKNNPKSGGTEAKFNSSAMKRPARIEILGGNIGIAGRK